MKTKKGNCEAKDRAKQKTKFVQKETWTAIWTSQESHSITDMGGGAVQYESASELIQSDLLCFPHF